MIAAGPPRKRNRRVANLAWLACYAVVLTTVIVLLLRMRDVSLREMSTPKALADWHAWRESNENRTNSGSVSRRPPKSPEPPELVLMRDHFPVVMTAAIAFSSLLFATMMITLRGTIGRGV